MEWLYNLEQQHKCLLNNAAYRDLSEIFHILSPSPGNTRKKSLVVLAMLSGFSVKQISKHLGIAPGTTRGYLADFKAGGEEGLFSRKTKRRKLDDNDLKDCIFTLLHEPPSLHGINRTTWRLTDLRETLMKKGYTISRGSISIIIKKGGFRWKSARVVLTSTDPEYREKYQHIQNILSHLKVDERFFSIDEYGPFAIKMKAGRVLSAPGGQPTVPQWQKSKGWLILTAALELSRNQVTHFYSKAKNTDEMIRMADILAREYACASKLYLSWDAASWHISKELKRYINEHNENANITNQPRIELAPLPASAQFLNVIY